MSDSDSSSNLTEEEELLDDRPAIKKKPVRAPAAPVKSGPIKNKVRYEEDDYSLAMREKADECAILYAERKLLLDEQKRITLKKKQIQQVIDKLEAEILEYLTHEDSNGRVPPNICVEGGRTFYVGFKDKSIKMDKEAKVETLTQVIQSRGKNVPASDLAEQILDGLRPKAQARVLLYK